MTMTEVRQGQIWAGVIAGGPVVVRVQNPPDERGVHVIALHSSLAGREATLSPDIFGSALQLKRNEPNAYTSEIAQWLEEARKAHLGGRNSHRYTLRIRTTENPAAFRAFIDDAREAGLITSYEDGSGAALIVDEIEGSEDFR